MHNCIGICTKCRRALFRYRALRSTCVLRCYEDTNSYSGHGTLYYTLCDICFELFNTICFKTKQIISQPDSFHTIEISNAKLSARIY